MDSSKKYANASPEVTSTFLSKLFFCWVLPFFKIGLKKDLEVIDLYNTTPQDYSTNLGDSLERNWEKEVTKAMEQKRNPSLVRALSKTVINQFFIYGIILFIECVILKIAHPIVLACLIKYFNVDSGFSEQEGWIFATGVIVIAFLNILIVHQANVGCLRIGMRCRVATCSLMYRKLLKLNKTALGQTAAGQIINLMSNDVQRFELACLFIHYIWIMPIQAIVAGIIMYLGVGFAAIVGILWIALQAVFVQGYLSKLQGKYRYKVAMRSDHRIKLMSEITSGIQIIKMYAWEKPFEKVVQLARKHEIDIITKKSYIIGFTTALMVFTERTSLYVAVVIYALTGNKLSSEIIFSMMQFFNVLQLYMSILFPMALASYAEAIVSVKRIEKFLMLPENEQDPAIQETNIDTGAVRIHKVKANWMPNHIIDTLSNINLEIKPGTLCAVVGSVGSGKSSLLQLLLKELPLTTGKLEHSGEISYASQEPWLFVSSVRNNILFGQPYDKTRYKEVVKVCALEPDFNQFSYGDKTLVGERGVSLSGGQRARINLARAVYRDADIYLFDDPLSAVDTHVGKHLFEECLEKYLSGKTRILVTHQIQFLKKADHIIVLNNGQIEKSGTFAELSEKELVHFSRQISTTDEDKQISQTSPRRERQLSITSENSTNVDEEQEPSGTEELMEKGSIPTSTYVKYFRSGTSIAVLLFTLMLIILAQVICNASDLWLKHWTNTEELSCNKTDILQSLNVSDVFNITHIHLINAGEELTCKEDYFRINFINIYTILIIGTCLLTTVRSLAFFKICMTASRVLHNTMFANILQATMRFFDINPSGRILNRFSKDIGAVDEILPRCMLDSIQIFMVMSGILIMVIIVSPLMIITTVFLGLMFWGVRYIYMSSAQDIKRLEGITKAPVFSHVTSTFSGITTIRSAAAQNIIIKEFDILQDQHTSSFVLMIFASETFGFYLDLASLLFLAVLTYQFLLFNSGSYMGGDVGLVISQSMILTGMLQHGMRQTTEVANNMTSVERVLQYTKLDKEGPFESEQSKKPKQDWPQKGGVKFVKVFLQYSPTEGPALKNLNIEIKPGEKIGIVGRTGAGKSTLIAAIFRLAPTEGVILIDDIDTKDIGLNDLRKNISIIPQEPVLFSTTVRNNLDPFDKCDDKTLWSALDIVGLKESVENLEQTVSEGGSNFSAGQRQLMCLARAIIRNNKIIIMDEATANVDQQTDSLIQNTIRANFKDCTVLTIAHRLNTIMDSDKVLVMNFGEAVEFAHPHELLQDEESHFCSMVQQTGKSMEKELRRIAKESCEKRTTDQTITNQVS